MIENYLLEELATFARVGTLAATAEELLITQPSVTRGMQKLEDELGVKLFERNPNSISLTDTGKYAAQLAQEIVETNNKFILNVKKFENINNVVSIGSVAPGPLIYLDHIKKLLPNNIELKNQLLLPESTIEALQNNDFSIVITDQEINNNEIESKFLGTESLYVNIDKFTLLANKPSVTFDDLKNQSFLVLSDIGIWKDKVNKQIPSAKFVYQEEMETFEEITKFSSFTYFSSSITDAYDFHRNEDDDRVRVPINEDAAKTTFYASYLKSNRNKLTDIISIAEKNWIK